MDEPVAKRQKLQPIPHEKKKMLVKKIHRYIRQKKLTDIEIKQIDKIFEMDLSPGEKQVSENESGKLIVVDNYSDKTFNTVIKFIKECEQNWAKKKEDRLFPTNKRVSSSSTKKTTNAKRSAKRAKVIDNPLIMEEHDPFDDLPDEFIEPAVVIQETDDAANNCGTKKADENHPLTSKLRTIDTKKHPLAYYKGPYNRVMRTARNIKSLTGIPFLSKNITSEPLGNADANVKAASDQKDTTDVEEENNELESYDDEELEDLEELEDEDPEELENDDGEDYEDLEDLEDYEDEDPEDEEDEEDDEQEENDPFAELSRKYEEYEDEEDDEIGSYD